MKSFLVIGMGRFGTAVAQELTELGQEVLAIDENVESVQRIAEDVTPDIYELCSKCNTSFMTFMQKDDEAFESWLKEVEQ